MVESRQGRQKALMISARWRQVDGSTRYALDTPAVAREIRAWARYDRVAAEARAGLVLVTRRPDGSLEADRWPGRVPPWTDIRDALRHD